MFRRAINPFIDMETSSLPGGAPFYIGLTSLDNSSCCDSNVVDKVIDKKGWKRCEWDEVQVTRIGTTDDKRRIQGGLHYGYRSKFQADYPWGEQVPTISGLNPCREDAPEWDEYRHYLVTNFAKVRLLLLIY